jgi:hypothetical protein
MYLNHIKNAKSTSFTGFTFNTNGLENKILQINKIVKDACINEVVTETSGREESTGLLIGLDKNWATSINKIDTDLQNAGIDELVQEVNRQLTDWKNHYQKN